MTMSLPNWVYKVLILLATIIWGLSFVVMKDAVDVFQPATIIGIRFAIAAVLMLLFFGKRILPNLNARYLIAGLILGGLYFLGFWVQTIGLTDTTPGKNAFLTSTYCVMVPFIYWVISAKRPAILNVVAAVLCVVGVGLVSLDGQFTMRFGDMMTLLAALCFGFHISFLGLFLKGRDTFTIAFLQFAVVGVLGFAIGLASEAQPDLSAVLNFDVIGQIAFLSVGASFLACLFQNLGQAKVPPSQAALLLSLESVFGVLFSVLFYDESLTLRLILGFALIFIAIVTGEVFADKESSWRKKKTSS